MRKITLLYICISLLLPIATVYADNPESSNYKLIEPSVGEPVNGVGEGTNYKILVDSSGTDDQITTSSNYKSDAGTANFIEAAVPTVECFETDTNTGTCSIGTNGMQEVCSLPGCYDRAKFRIGFENNPPDVRYAVQMSTDPTFATNSFYIDGVTRLPTPTITIADFLYKCEWEGEVVVGYCAAPNTTYQRYNVFGLSGSTTYYIRFSALQTVNSDADFTQSEFGPSATAATTIPSVVLDLDIAPDTVTPTTPPYEIDFGVAPVGVVTTAPDYIVVRVTTNAVTGIVTSVSGLNGALESGANSIPAYNGDLAVLGPTASGWGIRNDSATNAETYPLYLGSVTVSAAPTDFTDTGAPEKVGGPSTTFETLFTSALQPLHTGISAYNAKIRPGGLTPAGVYSETITFIVVGDFD